MKKAALLALFQSMSLLTMGQFFNGEIHYTVKIVPKKNNISADSILNLQPGTSIIYSIANGYYKSVYYKGESFTYSYTYHSDTKRMFDERAEDDYITFRDSRKGNIARIRSIPYKDSTRIIQGYKCYMVERVYEGRISKTYYAIDLKIDPESFKDHETGDWYNQIKEVNGAVSLSSIDEYATHYEINEVTKVKKLSLKPKDFELPDKMVVASESALSKEVGLEPLTKETIDCYRKKMAAAMEGKDVERERSFITLIVSDKGVASHLKPYEKDEFDLYKAAMDILMNCNIKFTPGQIGGKAVSSFIYFPVDFSR